MVYRLSFNRFSLFVVSYVLRVRITMYVSECVHEKHIVSFHQTLVHSNKSKS